MQPGCFPERLCVGTKCFLLFLVALTVGIPCAAQATLISRLGGQAYFDNDLGITWLADANLAASNTFGVAGAGNVMTWTTAQAWIAGMNAANYLGYSDWRLPTTLQPDPSCSVQQTISGSAVSWGTGCIASEMGHLFHVENISTSNPGPFSNVGVSWSDTIFEPIPSLGWAFVFTNGFQDFTFVRDRNVLPAWAVRTEVPEPATQLLFALGVFGLAYSRRRRR